MINIKEKGYGEGLSSLSLMDSRKVAIPKVKRNIIWTAKIHKCNANVFSSCRTKIATKV